MSYNMGDITAAVSTILSRTGMSGTLITRLVRESKYELERIRDARELHRGNPHEWYRRLYEQSEKEKCVNAINTEGMDFWRSPPLAAAKAPEPPAPPPESEADRIMRVTRSMACRW